MNTPLIVAVATALAASGCATASRDIATGYTSPIQYQSYDCNQLAGEAQRLQSRINQIGARLDEAAMNDKALVGVGLLVFWPAFFALGGTRHQEAEYARLKGEYEAIQQSAVLKRCPGVVAQTGQLAPQTPDWGANSQAR